MCICTSLIALCCIALYVQKLKILSFDRKTTYWEIYIDNLCLYTFYVSSLLYCNKNVQAFTSYYIFSYLMTIYITTAPNSIFLVSLGLCIKLTWFFSS